MDGLSVAASVIAVVQLTQSVIEYISDVKDAPKECRKLLLDFKYLEGLLSILQDTVQDVEATAGWGPTMAVLRSSGGPVESLKAMLEPFVVQLQKEASKKGVKRVVSSLLWPLTKKETEEIAAAIERQKLLLSIVLSNDHLRLSAEIKRDTATLRQDVETVQKGLDNVSISMYEVETGQRAHDTTETLRWLSPLQYQSKQGDTYNQRLDGSVTWFLECPEFQSWISGQHSTLCCVGIPGAGKTVLAATAIHHLQQHFSDRATNVGLAWVYCDFQARFSQTTSAMLGSIAAQLVSRRRDLTQAAIALRRENPSSTATSDNVKKLLAESIDKYQEIYLVIDALDEYSEDSLGWVDFVSDLQQLGAHIKLMVTCRPVAAIENAFSKDLRVTVEIHDPDARAYIRSFFNRPEFQKHLKNDDKLRAHIEDTLIDNAKGMFLLVKLHMDFLRRKATFSKAALREAVDRLPKRLDETYEQTLDRIKAQEQDDAELAAVVISWLYLSYSALTVRTLQQAIAKQQRFDPADEESLIDPEKLASVCAGLVAMNERSQIVGFVHYTAVEFLDTRFDRLYPQSRRLIDYCCFHHTLRTGSLRELVDQQRMVGGDQWWWYELQDHRRQMQEQKREFYQRYPFVNYALFHVQMLQANKKGIKRKVAGHGLLDSSSLTPEVIEPEEMELTHTLLLSRDRCGDDYTHDLDRDLIFAVYTGDESECKRILESPSGETSAKALSACLAYSVLGGTDAIFELLLDAKADPGMLHPIEIAKTEIESYGVFTELQAQTENSLCFAITERAVSKLRRILAQRPDVVNLPARETPKGQRVTPLAIALVKLEAVTAYSFMRDADAEADCREMLTLLRAAGATEEGQHRNEPALSIVESLD